MCKCSYRHRHRCNWVENLFCRCLCRCRAVWTHHYSVIFKLTVYYLLKWIKFSVLKNKVLKKILEKSGYFCQSGKVGTMGKNFVLSKWIRSLFDYLNHRKALQWDANRPHGNRTCFILNKLEHVQGGSPGGACSGRARLAGGLCTVMSKLNAKGSFTRSESERESDIFMWCLTSVRMTTIFDFLWSDLLCDVAFAFAQFKWALMRLWAHPKGITSGLCRFFNPPTLFFSTFQTKLFVAYFEEVGKL